MTVNLAKTRNDLARRQDLAEFEIHCKNDEIHLAQQGKRFARLIPTEDSNWQLEFFQNAEKWEIQNFYGRLEECLDFLLEQEHLRFWNR